MKKEFHLPQGIPHEALEEFIAETLENLDHAESCLQSLTLSQVNNSCVHDLFRVIHSIKGGSSYLGLNDIKELSHQFEGLLEVVRDAKNFRVRESFLNIAYEATSSLRKLFTQFQNNTENFELKPLLQRLEKYTTNVRIFTGKAHKDLSIVHLPEDPFFDLAGVTQETFESAELELARTDSDKIDSDKIDSNRIDSNRIDSNKIDSGKKEILTYSGSVDSSTMRIDQKHLDQFTNLVGELIVSKNAIEHLQSSLAGTEDERISALREFREHTARLASVSEQMQQTMRKVRLVPVKSIFQKYPAMIRELERVTGKKVQLVIKSDQNGNDIEIDKKIADDVSEPIMHLIRNAIDHGIESKEVRLSLGKSGQGEISLTAQQENGSVIITVSDDGAGIDSNKLASYIIQKGIISEREVERLSQDELLNFIFKPGITTASKVTEVSGRGVGLDIVQTKIASIHGKLSFQTQVGKGTSFRLELPTTMAVIESLLISIQDQIFAFPLRSILETIRIKRSELKSMMNKMALTLRNEVIGVEWLSTLLDSSYKTPMDENQNSKLAVLIVQSGQEKLGVVVDSIVRNQEVVVKPLPSHLASIPGLSGASILGDGRAVLILDPGKVISMSLMKAV